MAVSLVTLQAKRDALVLAMSSGEMSVQFEGRSVTYRSVSDMQKALSFLDGEIATAGGATRTDRFVYVQSNRG